MFRSPLAVCVTVLDLPVFLPSSVVFRVLSAQKRQFTHCKRGELEDRIPEDRHA